MPSASGKFVPPAGQTLLIIGQDTQSIDDYVRSVALVPAGAAGYTSLSKLEGLHETADYGSGPHNLDYLSAAYPQSVLVLGLDLVNFLPQVDSGQADPAIDSLLEALSAYQRPVFLRFGYEFDGPWNHYRPDQYVSAWRHFYKRMQTKGVASVALVWQSAAWCYGTYGDHPLEAWYPGDDFVDWIGLSYFVQVADCEGRPFDKILAFAREHQKPLMLAESTPQRYSLSDLNFSLAGASFTPKTADEVWNEWYRPFFDFIHKQADIICAVAYINANWDSQPMWSKPYRNAYWGDSRVQANEVIQERWLAEVNQPFWLNASPDLFEILGYQK